MLTELLCMLWFTEYKCCCTFHRQVTNGAFDVISLIFTNLLVLALTLTGKFTTKAVAVCRVVDSVALPMLRLLKPVLHVGRMMLLPRQCCCCGHRRMKCCRCSLATVAQIVAVLCLGMPPWTCQSRRFLWPLLVARMAYCLTDAAVVWPLLCVGMLLLPS